MIYVSFSINIDLTNELIKHYCNYKPVNGQILTIRYIGSNNNIHFIYNYYPNGKIIIDTNMDIPIKSIYNIDKIEAKILNL